jgi:hypothetical protein
LREGGSRHVDEPVAQDGSGNDPERRDERGCDVADRLVHRLGRTLSRRSCDLVREQPHDQCDTQGHDQEVIEVTEDRHEVRDQVDRAERVRRNRQRQQAHGPRRARIARGEVDDERLALEGACPRLESCQHASER